MKMGEIEIEKIDYLSSRIKDMYQMYIDDISLDSFCAELSKEDYAISNRDIGRFYDWLKDNYESLARTNQDVANFLRDYVPGYTFSKHKIQVRSRHESSKHRLSKFHTKKDNPISKTPPIFERTVSSRRTGKHFPSDQV